MTPSLAWLRQVALELDDLRDEVVFLGGAVAGLGGLLDEPAFLDALPGHLRPDLASQARRTLIVERITRLAGRNA